MSERVRRPEPDRIEPRRGLVGLVREASVVGAAPAAEGAPASGPAADVVSRSIGVGYRIVEEYLQQSRSAAAAMSPPTIAGDAMSGVAALQTRMVRATADLFDIWFQVLNSSSGARAPLDNGTAAANGNGAEHSNGHGNSASPVPAEAVRSGIEVEIASSRPARVAVDLRPGAGSGILLVHALRSSDESLPRIQKVSIDGARNGSPVVVRVQVPSDQPAGIYSGMIIEESSGLPVGTVSVIIASEERTAE